MPTVITEPTEEIAQYILNTQPGGITLGVARPVLAKVIENGTCSDDKRVIVRINEATKAILDHLIPVGGMITADVVAIGTELLLPPEMENAIEVEILDGALYRERTDVTQGWYNIVTQSTYIDPSMSHDNPMVDLGLVPDAANPAILRRKYAYPGLQPNAPVRVTGAKRYRPLKLDSDYLIVQNLLALKFMIQAIERYENNDLANGTAFKNECLQLLTNEVKKHGLDPTNVMKRKSRYEADLRTFLPDQFGYVLAQLALELPGGLSMGRTDLAYQLNSAERRLMEGGKWKNTRAEFVASIVGGRIYFPREVESILAATIDGSPIRLRGRFFDYQEGWHDPCQSHCAGLLIDQGEVRLSNGAIRREYKYLGSLTADATIRVLAKRRWISKRPADLMVIRNYEALRQMVLSIQAPDPKSADILRSVAMGILEKELQEYLAGIEMKTQVKRIGYRRLRMLR